MTWLFVLLALHGAIHLLGFFKAFELAEIPALAQPVPRMHGVLWLAACVAFLISAAMLRGGSSLWWASAALALLLSQTGIAMAWQDAKFGTLVNVMILVPVSIALCEALPSSLSSRFRDGVAARSERSPLTPALLSEADLAALPESVRAYVRYSGALGKPKIREFSARFAGEIRIKPDGNWMKFRARQRSFEAPRARLFLIESSLLGLPFVALHRYVGSEATMQVRVASLVGVVDARGPEMDQGETVTMLNDLCVLAPGALVSPDLRWEVLDRASVRATFTNAGHTVSAVLSFGERGELVNFWSDDRYLSSDGKTYTKYRWSTPLRDYREFHGHRLASRGDASWRMPSGELVYGRFELVDIEYN